MIGDGRFAAGVAKMTTVPLSVCFWDYDRTNPLVDNRVAIDGCSPSFTIASPLENFPRTFTESPFDVTEMSLSNYMTALAAGQSPYEAIPVFLSRTFRHGAFFVRRDRGIETPRDLEGKHVGLIEYDMTAAVVARGMLRDEYAVDTTKIHWRIGDVERHVRQTLPMPPVPEGVDVERVPDGKLLNTMLVDGELDAMIALEPPSSFTSGSPVVTRLFDDWRAAERAYFEKTGIFPIMHAVGIKRDLIAQHPWLPMALFDAFREAKRIATDALAVMNAPKVTLPWVAAELSSTKAAMGADYWPYGISANRRVLETTARYSFEDGLSQRRLAIEEIFTQSTHGT